MKLEASLLYLCALILAAVIYLAPAMDAPYWFMNGCEGMAIFLAVFGLRFWYEKK